MATYNQATGIPHNLLMQIPQYVEFVASNHAVLQFNRKYRGKKPFPTMYNLAVDNIVEVEETNGVLTKFVVRFSFDGPLDIVLPLVYHKGGRYLVTTAWFNDRNDTHKTLRKSRLVCV